MNNKTRTLLKSYILDYLKLRIPDFDAKKKTFLCPQWKDHPNNKECANIFPIDSGCVHCFEPSHGKLGDIFSIVRKLEPEMENLNDDEIGDYLIQLFKIQTDDKVNELFVNYSNWGWCLFPLRKQGLGDDSKKPIQGGAKWQKTEYRDIQQWLDWTKNGSGVALNLGIKSNAICIDIDNDETYEKVKSILNDTAIQTTRRGKHFVYTYDSDFDKTNHSNLRSKGYEMEVRANNAYIVIAPSSPYGETREWNNQSPQPMSKELKQFLLNLIDKPKEKELSDDIQEAIKTENLGDIDLSGQRNDTFVKLAGIFRKRLSLDNTEYALSVISNTLIDKPIPNKELKAMLQQIEKYDLFDKKELANQIYNHLQLVEQATARDLRDSLKQDKKDIEEALDYLIKENKIYKSRSIYHVIQRIEWTTEFVDSCKPLDVEVPYFEKYATFRSGDLIIIGGIPGTGKTHLCMNIIKKFCDQNRPIHYISTEAASRWQNIAMQLGLKEGDILTPRPKRNQNIYRPQNIELEDNAITIIDWINPENYAEVDKLYSYLVNQLTLHGGLLIALNQLRKNGDWFAPDLIDQYASYAFKYLYQNNDEKNTCFESTKMRETKVGKKYITIPTIYNPETKLLELRS